MCVCVWPCVCACVWQPTPRTADVTKIPGYVRIRILVNQWFFSYFWHSYFLRYGHFVEYMNMHAMNMWLTDASGRWLDFAPMASQQWWGVTAGQVRHNSSNVGGVTAGQVRHNASTYIIPKKPSSAPNLKSRIAAPCCGSRQLWQMAILVIKAMRS